MRSYSLSEAKSKFSTLFEHALNGKPQRVTRRGRDAVIIVSEETWSARQKSASTLADLFVKTIGTDARGFADVLGHRR